ncbi:MAG: hypothetical protein ACK4N5_03970 [Myxococcales bacterium]
MKRLLLLPLLLSTGCVATVRSRPPIVVSPTPTVPPVVVAPAPQDPTPPIVVVERPAPPPVVHREGPVYGPAVPPPHRSHPQREVTLADARRIALDYADRRGFFDARVKDVDGKKDHWKVKLELPRDQGKIKLEIDRCTGAIVEVDEDLKRRGRGQAWARAD